MMPSCLKYERACVLVSVRGIAEVILTDPNMAPRGHAEVKRRHFGAASQTEAWWSARR